MITDKNGNVWIVEPGRGVIHSPAGETPYYLMTNFPLIDFQSSGNAEGSGADRYKIADNLLGKKNDLDIATAFETLEAVKQSGGEWNTEFSMVYTQKENAVYYCYNGECQNIQKYVFA